MLNIFFIVYLLGLGVGGWVRDMVSLKDRDKKETDQDLFVLFDR